MLSICITETLLTLCTFVDVRKLETRGYVFILGRLYSHIDYGYSIIWCHLIPKMKMHIPDLPGCILILKSDELSVRSGFDLMDPRLDNIWKTLLSSAVLDW